LAEEGADIIAIDITRGIESVAPFYAGATEEDLVESAKQVEALGRRIVATSADVRDLEALRRAIDDGVRLLGRLDIVVANAGIFLLGASDELAESAWQDVIDVNLTGVWHTCSVATPHLRKAGGGSIVIISSTAGLRGSPNVSAYAASKHGLVGLMRTLANELAPDMIRVSTVHPGSVNTPMLDNKTLFHMLLPESPGELTLEDAAPIFQMANALPIPWVDPIDISNAVLFLASDEARYITGVTLPVDAGAAVK
jgi:(+)-trans-carveol dehydrogenase